ncbi:ADP-ribosylglycohydrolase family protein [Nocardia salmonicida]|uniref:ADP-ribosylglycohydrolase family protein n=1 Tax=Nocardia salmonicida TaxID=53431 RepID=UPI0037A45449
MVDLAASVVRGFRAPLHPGAQLRACDGHTLRRIRNGMHWREAAAAAFEGQRSCGNGAAMRVAPLGAFYCDDPERVATEPVWSAQV